MNKRIVAEILLKPTKIHKLEYMLLFICIAIFVLINLYPVCNIYSDFNFDTQNFLTWEFGSSQILPYKGIFYPYGLLYYFKNQYMVWHGVYLLLISTELFSFFIFIRYLFKERLLAYTLFLIFAVFIRIYTGFETFSRYATVVVLSLLYTFILQKRLYMNKRSSFVSGIVTGGIFSFTHDQGLYSIFVYILLCLANPLMQKGWRIVFERTYYKNLFLTIIFFLVGFLIGSLPLFIFLISNDALVEFIHSIRYVSSIASYAKTPYFHSLKSIENIFTYSALLITILLLTIKVVSKKIKFFPIAFFQLTLVIDLVILLQKSIIRDISKQLTFIALLLFFLLLYEFKLYRERRNISIVQITFFCALAGIMLLSKSNLYKTNELRKIGFGNWYEGCFSQKNILPKESLITRTMLKDHQEFYHVLKRLELEKDFNNKVFSFPGDPLFYVLLGQKPPYYFNNYDGSSKTAQDESIGYIEKEKIRYIVYNLATPSLQDGVPDYIRGSSLFRYLASNFIPYQHIDNFLVLKKNKGDFFEAAKKIQIPELEKSLLRVKFQDIPCSEGMYKINKLLPTQWKNSEEINNNLAKRSSQSSNKLLLVRTSQNLQSKTKIKIFSSDDLSTTVGFNVCKSVSILNLERIPLFYSNRPIRKIEADQGEARFSIVENMHDSRIW